MGDLLRTKPCSLETLFFGTAVGYAPADFDQFAPDINQSVEEIAPILLI
jgi:hypothetical protein